MKKSNLLLFLALFFSLASCLKDVIDLDDVSTEVAFERSIAMPLIYGSLNVDDFDPDGWDSIFVNFEGDTIKLYLLIDLGFSDTLELGDLGDNWEFEYFRLHHGVTNYLPLGLFLQVYLYDSLASQNLDTIFFTHPDSLFIKAAPVDSEGFVIEDLVTKKRGYVSLETPTLNYLQNEATHIILDGVVPNTDTMVMILDHYTLDLNFGIEAAGLYITDLDSIK